MKTSMLAMIRSMVIAGNVKRGLRFFRGIIRWHAPPRFHRDGRNAAVANVSLAGSLEFTFSASSEKIARRNFKSQVARPSCEEHRIRPDRASKNYIKPC